MTIRPYRLVSVSYNLFEEWLNLPEEFSIEGLQVDTPRMELTIRVRGPNEQKYHVGISEAIPYTDIHQITFPDGTKVLWHPDLGQADPSLNPGWALQTNEGMTPPDDKLKE